MHQSHASASSSPLPIFLPSADKLQQHSYSLWHLRLRHAPINKLNYIESLGSLVNKCDTHVCTVCPQAKQIKHSFALSESRAPSIFALIHCDVWGPYAVSTIHGYHFFLTIVDDHSRAVWLYLLKHKYEVSSILEHFFAMVSTQFQASVQVVRSDNGTEFCNSACTTLFSQRGIIHQTSCVDTPQQNGRVERKHRYILEMARALRFQSNLPLRFWGDCVLTAAFIINRLPTLLLQNKTPYEVLFHSPPSYLHLRVFECLCFASTLPTHRSKFHPRADPCVFLGYPFGQKGYKVYNLVTRSCLVSRNVTFFEHLFPFSHDLILPALQQADPSLVVPGSMLDFFYSDSPTLATPMLDKPSPHVMNNPASPTLDPSLPLSPSVPSISLPSPASSTSHSPSTSVSADNSTVSPSFSSILPTETSVIPSLRHSTRTRQAPAWLKDYVTASSIRVDSSSAFHQTSSGPILSLPCSPDEALLVPEWRAAMLLELQALQANHTWSVVPLPKDKRPIGCKWLFKVKYHQDGSVERYKARLVAQGFSQLYGFDYAETFAPVAKMDTVRSLLAVASVRSWHLVQMDVTNAFLHDDLDEELYMQLPAGLSALSPTSCSQGENLGMVCRLHKSIYGLKQAPRQWYFKLSQTLQGAGYTQSQSDHSLFTKSIGHASLTTILFYVDDIILAGNDLQEIEDIVFSACSFSYQRARRS
ncbi:hypothetical protein Dimus_038168 [Dionaea muscipula]